MFKRLPLAAALLLTLTPAMAQTGSDIGDGARKFNQLQHELPTPNVYRSATGEPGPAYWQQQVDYVIDVALDEKARRITGGETIVYKNNSPHTLKYLWVQLDQNRFKKDSLAIRSETASTAQSRRASGGNGDSVSYNGLARHFMLDDIDHGFSIKAVLDRDGKALPHTIVDTMMRIDLPVPLRPGRSTEFDIDWEFSLIKEDIIGGRGGYEHFPDNDTYIYFAAQWFPRMAALTDYTGWQHKAFLGRGEFTLEFGNYDVNITVPGDHLVAATGVLSNPDDVLTKSQRDLLKQAETANKPIFIVTPKQAADNEKSGSNDQKTWKFSARNVRDFAWSSSRKYIWDAMGHIQDDAEMPLVMAMSFYPNEAEPIWSKYSTEAVIHTMDVYSRFSFAYPYPTAQSVNTWERGGMEYPMITFNGYRPVVDEDDDGNAKDPTYSRRIKYGLIGVIIHEVGHIYFPMTVNSDERQWTWMDEGLNSFLDYVAALEWEENYPAYRDDVNVLDYITDYMKSENQVPIMTQSDSVLRLGPNAYSKPTAALIILRETVMGRELFDFAFKEYATRWKFKRPTPADFFRTMEDASGIDLDWFWRGWFFTTDHVDIGISSIREYRVSSQNPETEFPLARKQRLIDAPPPLLQRRNAEEGRKTRLDQRPQLSDFYNKNDRFAVSNKDKNKYTKFRDGLKDWEAATLDRALQQNPYIYFVDFENIGGLPMPIPMTLNFVNGKTETRMIPAEIWRRDATNTTKLLVLDDALASISIDDNHEIADADRSNNVWPQQISKSRLELYKSKSKDRDLMADMLVDLKEAKGGKKKASDVPLTPGN